MPFESLIGNLGVGIDIVDVKRFEKIPFYKNEKFYKKIFLPDEINYCLKFKNSSEKFAAKFAIEEAVQKSIKKKIHPLKISTYYSNSKPKVILLNHTSTSYVFIVSISHDRNLAIGVVISEIYQKDSQKNHHIK